jgi:hypothetical protein
VKRSICYLVAVFAFTAMAAGAASTKLTGYISDSMCGAKHMGTGAACVKKCIANGQKPVFVDAANKEVWAIDNPDAVKPVYYGAHVSVSATVDESAKSVHIDSIHTVQ